MDAGVDDGSFSQIEGALRSGAWIGQVPWLYWINDFLSPFIGNQLGINARHGSLRTFAAREVNNRKDRGSDHQDILDKLLQVQKEKAREMDDMAVLSMATSNIFAGSDTTAISIRSIIYYLLKNPDYKRKLVEEIDNRKNEGRLSIPVTVEESKSMPYLQACMYEALRCHPAVGMSLPRVTPPGGIEIDGRYIPQGVRPYCYRLLPGITDFDVLQTTVGVNPWVVHRDTNIFGEDVESFRPDRWLKNDSGDMGTGLVCFCSHPRGLLTQPLHRTILFRFWIWRTDMPWKEYVDTVIDIRFLLTDGNHRS